MDSSSTEITSKGPNRPSVSRGVQFAEGVELDSQNANLSTQQLAKASAPLSGELLQELERVAPEIPQERQTQIETQLRDLYDACRACCSAAGTGTTLLSMGSYQLGVLLPTEEVDVLFTAPLSLQLADLTAAFQTELERRGIAKNFTTIGNDGLLSAPGLRCEIGTTMVKVIISQNIPALPPPRAPEAIVQNMAGVYSREGAELILASVPNQSLFRNLLRFVRHWAKKRGVYGSFLGFPGGMAWAICCAKVCQSSPGIELSQLAGRFFRTMSRWDWRQPLSLDSSPVATVHSMTAAEATAPAEMTVLLPLGTGLSTTTQVTDTTMKITQKELRRAYKMVQQVELCRAHWTDVYKEAKFFQRHRHYLEFDFMASDEAIFAPWTQWGRQKLLEVIRLFEQMSSSIVTLRPWPEFLPFKDSDWPHATAVFVGLHLERGPTDGQGEGPRRSFDLREPIVKFLESVSQWPEAEANANKFELLIKHVRLSELQSWLERRQQGQVGTSPGGAGTAISGLSSGVGPLASGNNWTVTEEDSTQPQNCNV
mmetsp:Transcript_24197/g.51588  ORF Transcript_24197/g.51588 Transcript_24197/m.51588 type:complete len:540 (-) Transcript_24197:33-1652(-)